MAANFSTDVQYTLHFKTFSNDDPAVSRQSFICSRASSVWRSIEAMTTSPVSGSNGGRPETYRVSPCRVMTEAGAFHLSRYEERGSTRMICLFIGTLLQ